MTGPDFAVVSLPTVKDPNRRRRLPRLWAKAVTRIFSLPTAKDLNRCRRLPRLWAKAVTRIFSLPAAKDLNRRRRLPMQSQSGRSDIFLAYSQRPQQTSTASKAETNVFLLPALIDDIPKNTSPRKTKDENALRARAFGRSSSLGPLRNTHGFTKLN